MDRERESEAFLQRLLAAADPEDRNDILRVAEELRIERGFQMGQRRMLLKQLRSRFGWLPDATTARVERAGADEIDAWAERILTARTLDDVFESGRR